MKIFNIKKHRSYLTKLSLLTLPFLMMETSCKKDFLDAVPELSISDATAFDTPDRVLAQINGLYGSAKNGIFLGGRYLIAIDIRGDEFINDKTNGVTGLNVWNYTIGPDDSNNIGNIWGQGFLTINRCNVFLQGLGENASKITPELLANYKGEAKFLRALSFYSLLQLYAKPFVLDNGASPGLPLRIQAQTNSENNQLKRSTVAEVYAQILKDLNEAESELPTNYTGAAAAVALLNTTRAHKNSAVALKTRVYLTMGRYQDVITEGAKIVSENAPFTAAGRGVVNALQSDVTAIYKSPYTTLESVFSFPMTATNVPGTQNQLGYYYNSGNGANLEYYLTKAASGIFANTQWGASDVRRTAFVAAATTAKPYLTKFSNVAPFIDYVPSIRYAEVMLNVAEAEARVGSQTRGQAILEAVHKRSDASFAFAGGGQVALVNAILTERRIELLGEGFRTIDFMRLGQPIQSSGAGQAIPTNDSRYAWPIPTAEVQTNPGL